MLSRWPISAPRQICLATGEGLATVALMVAVHHPEGVLHFMTACLDWQEERQELRLHQARELVAILTAHELNGRLPVVLAGDMNAPPGAAEIQALTAGMTDCWADAQTDPGSTFDAANPYVSSNDWHAGVETRLAGQPMPGKHVPSDHYAVVADLSIAS